MSLRHRCPIGESCDGHRVDGALPSRQVWDATIFGYAPTAIPTGRPTAKGISWRTSRPHQPVGARYLPRRCSPAGPTYREGHRRSPSTYREGEFPGVRRWNGGSVGRPILSCASLGTATRWPHRLPRSVGAHSGASAAVPTAIPTASGSGRTCNCVYLRFGGWREVLGSRIVGFSVRAGRRRRGESVGCGRWAMSVRRSRMGL